MVKESLFTEIISKTCANYLKVASSSSPCTREYRFTAF